MTVDEQEEILRFHLHQMETLCGPRAYLKGLRTSQRVLCTAIMFARRFYTSNSVINFHPRHICAAAVLLAGKVEEEKLEVSSSNDGEITFTCSREHIILPDFPSLRQISLISRASFIVLSEVSHSALLRQELPSVSSSEIASAEQILMEGINYEFINHHASDTLREIAMDLTAWIPRSRSSSKNESTLLLGSPALSGPQASFPCLDPNSIHEKFLEMEKQSLIFSDTPFLCSPMRLAFAIAAVALRSYDDQGRLGEFMQDYLAARFVLTAEDDFIAIIHDINQALAQLIASPILNPISMNAADRGAMPANTLSALVKLQAIRASLGNRCSTCDHRQHKLLPYKRTLSWRDDVLSSRSRKVARITP